MNLHCQFDWKKKESLGVLMMHTSVLLWKDLAEKRRSTHYVGSSSIELGSWTE